MTDVYTKNGSNKVKSKIENSMKILLRKCQNQITEKNWGLSSQRINFSIFLVHHPVPVMERR